jgi:ABC-2 type transport system permease protein
VNTRVVRAIAKRDLRRAFNNPTGYVFVTLFVFLSAAAAFWRPRFFLNNLANLDQLVEVFPYLLGFFVPTLTMGLWADERRQGTDELLLTLPATDVEVITGKYLAALGTYTASILLSISHVFVLMWLGSPDPGLMFASYVGFWLAGAGLIAVGMLASLLTANTTIAFILGSLFCWVPIGLSTAAGAFSGSVGRRLAPFSVPHHLDAFGAGLVTVTGVLYFVCLAGLFLYLSVIVLGRRFWRDHVVEESRDATGRTRQRLWVHHAARAIALVVLIGSTLVIAGRLRASIDLTSERTHSLSAETRRLVDSLPEDRPVVVQAFVSPEVPQLYVQARENLLAVLRGIEAMAGGKVSVVVEDTAPYSDEAERAGVRYGIAPRAVTDPFGDGTSENVYLGVAFTSGPDEQVIPFFDRGLSPEYEVTRALRVVTRSSRKRIGIIDADVKMAGGVNFGNNQSAPPWAVIDELRKQYDVVEIAPYGAITEKVDALIVVMPSRLSVNEMELVAAAIRNGTPTLILVDPLPLVDMNFAPAAPMAAQIDPFRRQDPSVQINYGDVRAMLVELGINWVPARIAWDSFNAHPDMAGLPAEAVFVAPSNGNADALNRSHAATRGMQEILLLYPGYVLPAEPEAFEFEPLLQTGKLSGTIGFFQATRPTPSGPVLAGGVAHEPDGRTYVLAAHVRSKQPLAPAAPPGEGAEKAALPPASPTNVIIVADVDLVSDYFFELRRQAPVNASFDNIAFFLNAIDVLAGDESFIPLRNKRVRHRTLARVEAQTQQFLEQRSREEQQAEKEAQAALEGARERLKNRVQEIQGRKDLDDLARQIMTRNLEAAEERRLRVLESSISLERNRKIQASRQAMEARVRQIRGAIRLIAVLLPPVPVLLMGIVIFTRRRRREREGARAARRLLTPTGGPETSGLRGAP